MKPDKHKQKQSAKYKKKHGMEADKSNKGGAAVQTGGSKSQNRGKPDNQGKGAAQVAQPIRSLTLGQFVDSQIKHHRNDSEEEDDMQPRRSFKCREIESNWQKYEGLEQSVKESESTRGSDFKNLLGAASSAVAQFRFADEKEWSYGDAPEDPLETDSLLAVDGATLAVALQSLPLPERLAIEESAFEEHDLVSFRQAAAQCRLTYGASFERDTPKSNNETPALSRDESPLAETVIKPSCVEPTQDADEDLLDDILTCVSDVREESPSRRSADPHSVIPSKATPDSGPVGSKEEPTESATAPSHRSQQNHEHCPAVEDEDNILDNLLCITSDNKDTGKKSDNKENKPNPLDKPSTSALKETEEKPLSESSRRCEGVEQTKHVAASSGLPQKHVEEDLEFLLSLADVGDSKAQNIMNQKQPESKPTDTSLDDWLDSVLDA